MQCDRLEDPGLRRLACAGTGGRAGRESDRSGPYLSSLHLIVAATMLIGFGRMTVRSGPGRPGFGASHPGAVTTSVAMFVAVASSCQVSHGIGASRRGSQIQIAQRPAPWR